MNKIIPFFVVSILVISSYGAVAITRERPETLNTEPPLPGAVRILIKGGLGVTTTVKSSILLQDAGFIQFRTKNWIGKEHESGFWLPDPIFEDTPVTIYEQFSWSALYGGLLKITIKVYLWRSSVYSDDPEMEFTRFAFWLGPFILFIPIISSY